MNAAIFYEPDGYRVHQTRPMGRHFAGHGFLSAFAKHAQSSAFHALVRRPEAGREFAAAVQAHRPGAEVNTIVMDRIGALQEVGCLYVPEFDQRGSGMGSPSPWAA